MADIGRSLTEQEKALLLAARQPNGKPYFAPRLTMTDAERLAHIGTCGHCQDRRHAILAAKSGE